MDGNRIKTLRKELNLSQTELASILGVTAVTVSRYEGGRDPGTEVLIKLAKTFGVTVDYLSGFSDSRYPTAKISGDDVVDSLAAKFASMAKPLLDRAQSIDDSITKQIKQPEPDENGWEFHSSTLANSAIFSYLHYAIDRIGEDIDSCLDNSDRWINVDLNGQLVFNRDLAAGMLSNDYLKYVIECDKEKVKSCQDQQKTPDQSESVQTELGKDD